MSYANSKIKMKDGDVHFAMEYPDDVRKKVQECRSSGDFVELESQAIPTGQKFFIDADEVQSITRSS